MRNALALLVGALALNACSDDGDHAAPDTQIDIKPDPLTNQKASFQFHAIGTFSEFLCSFDGEEPASCISPLERDLADGDHTFTVAARLLESVDLTPATAQWKLDTVAPDTTLGTVPPDPDNNATPSLAFTGTDDQGAVTFECAVDGAAAAACTSPFGVSVADGNHTFTVSAVDAAGNRDASPATYGWNVNTTAPQTTITAGPTAASTTAAQVSFSFSSPDTAATFECSIDGGAFAACTSPKALTLTDGAHTFAVRAVGFGGTDPSPETIAWNVDAVAPTTTITVKPNNPSNDTTPAFQFTATETATFECQIDGLTTFAACTSPFESPALVDGSTTFRVRATDGVGNGGADATFTWVVDTAAPTVTINSEPPANTNDNTPTVTFTPAGTPTLIECAVDGGTFAACTSPFTAAAVLDGPHTISVRVTDAATNSSTATTGAFNVDTVIPTVSIGTEPSPNSNDTTPTIVFSTTDNPTVIQCKVDTGGFAGCTSPFTTTVAPGNHTITVRVADAANNSSTDVTATFIVDTTPPTVAINTQPLALSNDNTPTVVFTTGGTPNTIECQLDSGAFAACTSPFTTTVADGTHTITIKVTDVATNSASATTASFKVDTVTPTVTITVEPSPDSNDTTPTIVFTTTDNPTSIQCQIDSGTFANCTSPFTSAALAEGSHTITVKVSDGVNSSTDTTAAFIIDTTPPTVVINTQPLALSNDNTPTVTFTPGGSPTAIECTVDNGTFAACTSPFTTTVADGTHTITVRVTDGAGLQGSATTSSFKVDTVTPTVTITVEPSPNSNDTTPTIQFTTTDSPSSIQCQIDSGTFANCTSPFTSGVLAEGTHTITVKVSDGVNSSTDTTAPFIIDTTPPTVAINTQPLALSNDNTPTVTFTTGGSPTTTECRVDTGTFTACSGSFTPTVADGTHTITVHVVDGAGLQASATTNNFTVDTVTPTVTITVEPAANSNDTTPTIQFTTTDNPTSIQCQIDSGSFVNCTSPFTTGALSQTTHTITVKVSDGVNSSTDTTAPFIIDTTPPTVTINTQPAALSNDNTPTMTFTTGGSPTVTECQVDTGAFTSCASGTFTPAAAVSEGAHTMTVHVVDAATNQASATTNSFTVDTVKPVVTFDDVPPALWPVNYFDMKFHANETVTFTCSLNGAAFSSCSSPLSITTTYNVASTFSVRATDGANNFQTATTNWTSVDGLVLHYAYEQGGTTNSSLLEQNTAYSPAGDVTTLPFVGGWAGTAAGFGVQKHIFAGTRRALTSSAQVGNYTASFWIRTNIDTGNGTIFSTLGATGGLRVLISGNQVTVQVREGANVFSAGATIAMNRWCQVALRTTGPTKGVDIFVDGAFANHVSVPVNTGFEATQSNDLTVGPVTGLDLDDLRFFNRALSDLEMCTSLARGATNPNNGCVPLSPGLELDFENDTLKDTGAWQLPLAQPQLVQFVDNTKTGGSMFLKENTVWGYPSGFNGNVNAVAGHSFSMWFTAGSQTTTLIDFTQQCNANSANQCGILLNYNAAGVLNIFAGSPNVQAQKTIGIAPGRRGLVITEQREGTVTHTITVYVDGKLETILQIDNGNVFQFASDSVRLVPNQNVTIDELEFWTKDLSSDNEILCENGFDGLFVPESGACLMTSN